MDKKSGHETKMMRRAIVVTHTAAYTHTPSTRSFTDSLNCSDDSRPKRGRTMSKATRKLSSILDTVITGDNAVVMPELPGQTADIVLFSPPYNLGRASSKLLYGEHGLDNLPHDEYVAKLVNVFRELERVAKREAPVLMNLGYGTANANGPGLPFRVVTTIEQTTNWRLLDTICWQKTKPPRPMVMSPVHLSRAGEYIFVFGRKELGQKREGDCTRSAKEKGDGNGRYKTAGFTNLIEAPCGEQKAGQSATFSVDLVDEIFNRYIPKAGKHENFVVIDPFCGSGTVGIACRRRGLHFIGIEIDSTVANRARGRLMDH